MTASEEQFEAARRFFRRHPRPRDPEARYRIWDAEERRQDSEWIARGGNA